MLRAENSVAAQKDVFRLVDPGGEIRRPPLVGMQFLHQRPMGAADFVRARTGLQAKDLVGLLFRHFAGGRAAAPRCRITLRVFTPAGFTAVKIRQQ